MSTYLSHPVRRIRDDPRDGETVSLVVELDEAAPETFLSTVETLSGSLTRELRFDSYLIELPQPAVAELCTLDGLTRIETANTLSTAPVESGELETEGLDETGVDGETNS